MKEKNIDISDFAECTFWAVECPECQEMIELNEPPTRGQDVLCDHCESRFEVKSRY